MAKVLMVDPPSGWKYGFPKPLDKEKSYEQQLKEAGYPEEDIPFALKHSRYYEADVDITYALTV
jgi:hypothetical protein